MGTDEKVKILESVLLFKNISVMKLTSIASITSEIDLESGDTFIYKDDPCDKAFIIYQGSVRVCNISEKGDEITLAVLGPGDMVGDLGLLDNKPRSANVKTIQNTKMLTLKFNDFREILLKQPEITISLLETLAQRIRLSNQQFEDTLTKSLYERVWKILEALSNFYPNNEITLSHEEIALIVGASRARVTETLDQLKRQQKIDLQHKKIKLL